MTLPPTTQSETWLPAFSLYQPSDRLEWFVAQLRWEEDFVDFSFVVRWFMVCPYGLHKNTCDTEECMCDCAVTWGWCFALAVTGVTRL